MTTPIPDWATEVANNLYPASDSGHPVIPDADRPAIAQAIADAYSRATQTLTCVYCGHEYPPGTPSHGSPVLTAHIKTCEKHPLGVVRRALVGLVGVDTAEELDQMEGVIRLTAAPAADKVGILDAIHALKATL
jgi:hypothetical protein